MNDERIARRYARAMFNAARQQNILREVDTALTQLADVTISQPQLMQLIHNPMIALADKETAVVKAIDSAEMPELVKALMVILIRKRREALIQAVWKEFEELFDQELGEIRVTAKSARPLSEEQKRELINSLAKRTGRDVILTVEVDEKLMGGMSVQIGDSIIDGSIRGHLTQLREMLSAI